MHVIDEADVAAALDFTRLVPALRDAFIEGAEVPIRHRHAISGDASLLLMPVWRVGGYLVVKVVTAHPHNRARGLPGVSSVLLLIDAGSGERLALVPGEEVTRRRTAAMSALAARYLARPDARRLLVVGAGQVADVLADAYRSVLPIERVEVWNRTPATAAALARRLTADGLPAGQVDDLAGAAARADIVSCATMTDSPLVRGEWLAPGTHVDLIGGFTSTMREADDETIRRSSVFVDTPAALEEAGDLVQPMTTGLLDRADVQATLSELCRGWHPGRRGADEVTVFKSVGTGLADLAAAVLVYRAARQD